MSQSPSSSLPGRLGGFVIAVARRFYDDQCLVRASALAYTTLLSMVPLLAVMFAVLKGLGAQQGLGNMLLSRLSLSPETSEMIVGYVDKVNVGTIGGLGAAMLLLTVISVLGGIEASFNYVWRVARSRSVWRKATDYFSVILLTPFLMLAAGALTSSLEADRVVLWLESWYVGTLAMHTLELAPIAINVLAIGVLYAVMPNRRPSASAVLVGAFFAGLAWHFLQLAYIRFQIGMANYNAIYGALSQLPITLVWLYVSWAVVLFGAEIAAVYEFGWQHLGGNPVHADPVAVELHLLVRAAESFRERQGGIEAVRSARELGVNVETVVGALASLHKHNWLVPVDGSPSFVLACEPQQIRLAELEVPEPASIAPRGCDQKVRAALARLDEKEREVWSSWTLADVLTPPA